MEVVDSNDVVSFGLIFRCLVPSSGSVAGSPWLPGRRPGSLLGLVDCSYWLRSLRHRLPGRRQCSCCQSSTGFDCCRWAEPGDSELDSQSCCSMWCSIVEAECGTQRMADLG